MKAHPLIIALGCVTLFLFPSCRKSSSNESTAPDKQGSSNVSVANRGPTNSALSATNAGKNRRSPSPDREKIVNSLLIRSSNRPGLDLLTALQPEDKQLLTEYYRSHSDPLDRLTVAWGLGFVGDENTAAMLINALTNEYSGKLLVGHSGGLQGNQEFALAATLYPLGLLAAKYGSVFSFLTNATTARFWHDHKRWKSEPTEDPLGGLVMRSIVAVGMTGRPEVPQTLTAMKDLPLKNEFDPTPFARTFEGAVVDAAFYCALIQDRGMDGFLLRFFGTTDVIDADGSLGKWLATEEGKVWNEWYHSRENPKR